MSKECEWSEVHFSRRRLEEGEDKERTVTEGLMYVKRHAATYEEQVLEEPSAAQREEEAAKQAASRGLKLSWTLSGVLVG